MTIITTRAQRRELERQNAKLPRELQPIPRHEWPATQHHGAILRVWRSRGFLVQEYAEPAPVLVRLSVLRTTLDAKTGRWVDSITWDQLQDIKAQCGYAGRDAVEVYPRERDTVNVANLRHLWVMREPLAFAWRMARDFSFDAA
jgi:hypothetical protein